MHLTKMRLGPHERGQKFDPLINLNHSDCIKIAFMRDHETVKKKVEVKMVLKSKMGR